MATNRDRQAAVDRLLKRIEQIEQVRPESVERPQLGEYAFPEAPALFAECRYTLLQVATRNISYMPVDIINGVSESADSLYQLLDDTQKFVSKSDNAPTNHAELVKRWLHVYDPIVKRATPIMAITSANASAIAGLTSEAKGLVDEAQLALKHLREQLETKLAETNAQFESQASRLEQRGKQSRQALDAVVHAARESLSSITAQAALAGVSQNAVHFSEEANAHRSSSRLWLATSLSLGIASLAVSSIFLYFSYEQSISDIRQSIQILVGKILIISILTFAFIWSTKNYRSHKHNQTLNRHRQNALATFQTFANGSGDARVKDLILVQAAEAAFSSRSTGFESGESDSGPTTGQIVEALGRASPLAKSSA